jgi:HlyD family secretion protein
MRRVLNWLVVLLLAGASFTFVILAFRPEPIAVESAQVACGALQVSVDVEGRTRIRDRFVISAPISGRISRMTLREGDPITPTTSIVQITPVPLDVRTQNASRAAIESAEAQRLAANSNLERAGAARDQANRDFARVARLAENGIASPHELEQASLTVAMTQKAYEAAVFASQMAASQVTQARAPLISLPITVRSPVTGRVLHVLEKSERVVSAGDALVEIGDARALELVFETLSADAVRIRPGADVLVEHWGGEQVLRGSVRAIEPSAFTKISALGVEEQRVNVLAILNEGSEVLGDGYRVEGRIVTWRAAEVVKAPVSSLFRTSGSWKVFVITDGFATARSVDVGQRNDNEAEIIGGLAEGETVILYPDDRIKDGIPVVLKPR